MIRSILAALVLISVSVGCSTSKAQTTSKPVGLGIDSFLKDPPAIVKGKRIGLITNHTGVDSRGRSDIDTIRAMKDVKLVALFAPEHGIRGDAAAGAKIASGVDEKTGIPVHSLYDKTHKPTPEVLKDVDVLMFDIQDVGARCYTYPSTMANGMMAAKEKGIPFVVLDRPNPIGGEIIESNLLDPKFSSFVGMYAMPMRHGLTVGEWAQMANDKFGIGCNLVVVKCTNLKRSQWWDDTKLEFLKPSPNLPRLEACIHYPGLVFFEGTNLSCGRGTDHPFEQVGVPWLDSAKVIDAMNAAGLKGVKFEKVEFTPKRYGNRESDGKVYNGVRLIVTDRNVYQPVRTGVMLVDRIRSIHPNDFQFRGKYFQTLSGTDEIRKSIEAGTLDAYLKTWTVDEETFRATRKPYLLYN